MAPCHAANGACLSGDCLILVIWALAHAAVGAIMLLYCLARSLAGRLTPAHDLELHNVALYWHFMAITAVVTFAVIGLFPETV